MPYFNIFIGHIFGIPVKQRHFLKHVKGFNMRKTLFERKGPLQWASQQGIELRLNSKYKDKWRFTAKEWDGRVREWKIDKRGNIMASGILARSSGQDSCRRQNRVMTY